MKNRYTEERTIGILLLPEIGFPQLAENRACSRRYGFSRVRFSRAGLRDNARCMALLVHAVNPVRMRLLSPAPPADGVQRCSLSA